ncbi:MAG: FAD-dependent oxidoreductase, partial [Acetobacteraceae bacterium]|nr:FAD-dependent oxidoreductase [Acetobacteraceae bacterium]
AAAAGALASAPSFAQVRRRRADARVAVIGAGLAGLVAAYRLVQAGVANVTVYEANRRIGGRVLSGRDVVGDGTLVELGGSFINSDHEDMLALAREFGLGLEDGQAGEDGTLAATYWIGGRRRTLREIAEESRELLARLESLRKAGEAAEAAADRKSVAAMLDEFGVSGWLRTLLDIGLTQEMGAEPGAMSALYLVEAFAPDVSVPKRGLFSSDQRFQVEGGNDRIPASLAERLGARVRLGERLSRIAPRGQAFALAFGPREVVADIVVVTLPATMLRGVAIDAPISPLTRRAIRELAYGSNAKLFGGVAARPWRGRGDSGECLNDFGFQTCWEDHGRAGTGAGTLTIFAGGRAGVGFRDGRPDARVRDVAQLLETAFPGAAAAVTGKASRMHWPSNPYVGASYSCFAPGQWVGFSEAWAPAGRILFAGEHTSGKFSGYMNGGAESGRLAAAKALALLG